MTSGWRDYRISEDLTHHTLRGRPAYGARFKEVLKFHEPGLAPVLDKDGAYHVDPGGESAYPRRYIRTFGYYEGRAAVHSSEGWFHILPEGKPLYEQRFGWCGNFQEGRCTVRTQEGRYFHINLAGVPVYRRSYRYAGDDFRDGWAVVQDDDGLHTHIDTEGNEIHGKLFQDLDVFHKGLARACDSGGWHHIDIEGNPLYSRRFQQVEPFYNGQSRVGGLDGSLLVIDESGETLLTLRKPASTPLERLSGEMVGLWRTQTLRASVELGVFESLPDSAAGIEQKHQLAAGAGARLMRALLELGLVRRSGGGVYSATESGAHLEASHPLSLRDAALYWGRESYAAWAGLIDALRTGKSSFAESYGLHFFEWIAERPSELKSYHRAMATYARHDYGILADVIDFGRHKAILDAGGGTGELAYALLRRYSELTAVVMDRPEVVRAAVAPDDIEARFEFIAGDLFGEWPPVADAAILARVLHDWPDEDAILILKGARAAMDTGGTLYVAEMVLDGASGSGGLLDLNMLAMTGGAERTATQYSELLRAAGFEMKKVVPTGAVSSVIGAVAV